MYIIKYCDDTYLLRWEGTTSQWVSEAYHAHMFVDYSVAERLAKEHSPKYAPKNKVIYYGSQEKN